MLGGQTKAATFGAVGVILAEFALALSDYHSPVLAVILGLVGVGLLLPLLNVGRKKAVVTGKVVWNTYGPSKLRRSMIAAILIGALVGGCLGGAMWKLGTSHGPVSVPPAITPTIPAAPKEQPKKAVAEKSREAVKEGPEKQSKFGPDWIAFPRPPEPPPPFSGIGQLFSKPTFPADVNTFVISVMGQNRKFSIAELKKKSELISTEPNTYSLAEIYIVDEILCIDATTVGGVRIRGNQHEVLPQGWDSNWSDQAIEIINENGSAVYQVRLVQPTVVEFSGAILANGGKTFVTPGESGKPAGGEIERLKPLEKDGQVIPAVPILTKRIFKYPGYQHRGKFVE